DGGGLSHFRRNSPPSATPVVAQNRNIHLSSSLFSSASFTSSWCQRPSHFASDSARRCSSLASNRAKLRSFRSRRSARYVASTALNQFTSSFVMSCRKSLLGAGAESRVHEKQILRACGAQDDKLACVAMGEEGTSSSRTVPNSSNDVPNSARSVVSSPVESATPGAAVNTRSRPARASVAHAQSFTLTVVSPG